MIHANLSTPHLVEYALWEGGGGGGILTPPSLLLSRHQNKGREYTMEITQILEVTFKVTDGEKAGSSEFSPSPTLSSLSLSPCFFPSLSRPPQSGSPSLPSPPLSLLSFIFSLRTPPPLSRLLPVRPTISPSTLVPGKEACCGPGHTSRRLFEW